MKEWWRGKNFYTTENKRKKFLMKLNKKNYVRRERREMKNQ